MKDLPLLFTGEMMRANTAGIKTQTRRLSGLGKINAEPDRWHLWQPRVSEESGLWAFSTNALQGEKGETVRIRCPYGVTAPGRKIWARETFVIESNFGIDNEPTYPPPFNDGRPLKRISDEVDGDYWEQCHYQATDPAPELAQDGVDGPGVRWSPSIHMPRWACRFERPLIRISCERLQSISEPDAIAEGITGPHMVGYKAYRIPGDSKPRYSSAVAAYETLWESINGAGSWAPNPYVWVIEYKNEVTA